MGINIAMGYALPEWSAAGTKLAIGIIGERSAATVRTGPMFDPAHDRPRLDAW